MVKDRNESLQVNSRWKALDEIYKINKLLHRSAFKNSAKFRQTFSHFYSFTFKISAIFHKFCSKLANFDEFSPEFQQFSWRRSKSPRFSNFLRFRNENCWIFPLYFWTTTAVPAPAAALQQGRIDRKARKRETNAWNYQLVQSWSSSTERETARDRAPHWRTNGGVTWTSISHHPGWGIFRKWFLKN